MSALTKVNSTSKFAVIDLASLKVDHTKQPTALVKREISRANKESGDRILTDTPSLIGGPFTVNSKEFQDNISVRTQYFEEIFESYQKSIADKQSKSITITLPNGDVKNGFLLKTTPIDIAKEISSGLADAVVIAKVVYSNKYESDLIVACDEDDEAAAGKDALSNSNGELWDLNRPLAGDCTLTLLKYDDPEAKTVFWHSSAHILGAAIEAGSILINTSHYELNSFWISFNNWTSSSIWLLL